MNTSQIAKINMVKQQLRTGNVLNETILSLFDTIPRDAFVPHGFKDFAYSDLQIPLAHGQRMMSPLEEGILLQELALQGHEVVLEVGTGSGFLTAMLSRLCRKVISIDYFEEFTVRAAKSLSEHHCTNVELITGDASAGWLDKAPYDVIVFTGALESLSQTQRLQILPGGKLFAIIGKKFAMQGQLHHLSHEGVWNAEVLFETSLPPLIDKLKPKDFDF
ncbi:MAG: protein-L-isoaspartate O-methyltransferase [Tatlockia sp.]|jgi:protein-L-isoaspartate(D-aspartate) O-methyltransferase